MKTNLKTKTALVLCCLMILFCTVASACGPYVLFPDSDTRELTRRELNGYSYDALGYAFHEIVARHGYHFDMNSKYSEHFESIADYDYHTGVTTLFYTEAPASVTNEMIVNSLSHVELVNMYLIEQVRQEKAARGEYTGPDESIWLCNGDCWD